MARNVPNWLKGYIEYTKHLEAPDTFHLWAAIGAVAGALRGKVWIDQGYFTWKPNFFIIFVAPPGVVSKSTTMGVAMEMLRCVDNINLGPDSATWQAVTESFVESIETVPDIGQMSCMTIAASELGTFLDPRNREMVDVLNDLWDGKNVPWKRRTKGEGLTEIPNPWINFMGCTTPGWIEENFPEYAIKGGFTSRTVFVYAEAKRQLVAYPKLRMDESGQEFSKLRRYLINDLKTIGKIKGTYHLTDDAIKWGEDWYKAHWASDAHPGLDKDIYGGYIARKQTHVHKLAMIMAACEHDEMMISAENLEVAEQLLSSLEGNLPKVFVNITDSQEAQHTALLIKIVQRYPKGVAKRDLWRTLMKFMSQDEFKSACQGAIIAEYVYEYASGTDAYMKPR